MTGDLLVCLPPCLGNCILISSLYIGYDASVVSGTGFSAFASCGASGSETPKYPRNQQRADKASWLWPCTNLQFSDGSYLSGKFLNAFIYLLTWQCEPFLQLKLLVSLKTVAFHPGLKLWWLHCTDNQSLTTGCKLNCDWLQRDKYVLVFWNSHHLCFCSDTDFLCKLSQTSMLKVSEVFIFR